MLKEAMEAMREFLADNALYAGAFALAVAALAYKGLRRRSRKKNSVRLQAEVVDFTSGFDGRPAPVFSFVYRDEQMEAPADIREDFREYHRGDVHTVVYLPGEAYVTVVTVIT